MNINDEFYKKGRDDAIQWLLAEAKHFECCPFCGNPDLKVSKHYCEKCGKRIVEPDDAYWFYEYLLNKIKSKKKLNKN